MNEYESRAHLLNIRPGGGFLNEESERSWKHLGQDSVVTIYLHTLSHRNTVNYIDSPLHMLRERLGEDNE